MTNESYQRSPIPPIDKYWDRPPMKEMGDDNEDTVFLSVGRALSQWESLESILAMMFGLFVESDSSAAVRAYGAIASSTGRKDALAKAAEVFSSKRGDKFPQKDFDLLMNHFGKAQGRRNEIAHGMVMSFKIGDQARGFFLVPAHYNSRKTDAKTLPFWREVQQSKDEFRVFGHDYRYTSADIDHFITLFSKLAIQANGLFMEQLMGVTQERFERAPNDRKSSVTFGALTASPRPKTQ